jgi:ClpX C4-type zinc finger protein
MVGNAPAGPGCGRALLKEDDVRVPECAFCGRREDQVRALLYGPDASICDRCVGVCNRLLHEAGVPVPTEPVTVPRRRRRSWWRRLGLTGA